ncbi:unnamed protein product [Euphydryas editha]|uniref:Uncharacterized protein n=1 Tax=Euphydryas editha TaxID=104508 RepID=A0AAU9V9W2_EUPED|nr:unnamed protein product [Euphydryas editha]
MHTQHTPRRLETSNLCLVRVLCRAFSYNISDLIKTEQDRAAWWSMLELFSNIALRDLCPEMNRVKFGCPTRHGLTPGLYPGFASEYQGASGAQEAQEA